MSWEFDGDESDFWRYVRENSSDKEDVDDISDPREIRSSFLEAIIPLIRVRTCNSEEILEAYKIKCLLESNAKDLISLARLLKNKAAFEENKILAKPYDWRSSLGKLEATQEYKIFTKSNKLIQNYFGPQSSYEYFINESRGKFSIRLPQMPYLNICQAFEFLTVAFSNNYFPGKRNALENVGHVFSELFDMQVSRLSFIEELLPIFIDKYFMENQNILRLGNSLFWQFPDRSWFSIESPVEFKTLGIGSFGEANKLNNTIDGEFGFRFDEVELIKVENYLNVLDYKLLRILNETPYEYRLLLAALKNADLKVNIGIPTNFMESLFHSEKSTWPSIEGKNCITFSVNVPNSLIVGSYHERQYLRFFEDKKSKQLITDGALLVSHAEEILSSSLYW